MPRRTSIVLLLGFAAAFGLSRCSLVLNFDKEGLPCADGGVCLAGYACVDGACTKGTPSHVQPNGSACQAAADCVSGFCVSGVCCNSACTEACNSCALPASPGACGLAPFGFAGSPVCSPYVCSGTVSTCPNVCTDDSQCAPGNGCSNSNCIPKLGAFAESFTANGLDGGTWFTWADPGNTAPAQQNGVLQLTAPAASGYSGMDTNRPFDGRGSFLLYEVVDAGNRSVVPLETGVTVYTDSANTIFFGFNGTGLLATAQTGGSWTNVRNDTAYSASQMRYLRIREQDGGVFWEYSSQIGCCYALYAQKPTPFPMDRVFVEFSTGSSCTRTGSSTALLDNVNVLPKLRTLQDNFDDNATDTSKWVKYVDPTMTVAEQNGRLEITAGSGHVGWSEYFSVSQYDARDSSASLEVKAAVDPALSSCGSFLLLETPFDGDRVELDISGGLLIAQKKRNGPNWTQLKVAPYDATAMRFLRIREAAGVTYWEYSADGLSYKTFHSEADVMAMFNVAVHLSTGCSAAEGRATTAAYDNFNLP